MRTVLFLILSLLLTPVHASVSTSAPTATDFSGQLDEFTDLLTVDAEGGSFRALRNSSLAPELLGGAVLLGDTLPGWITQTAALRTGLATQGWDLLSAEPAEEAEEVNSKLFMQFLPIIGKTPMRKSFSLHSHTRSCSFLCG